MAPEALARHVRMLQRAGYQVLTASEAVASAHPRAAGLTFDDGYADNLEIALPLLASLGVKVKGTIYVVTGEIGGAKPTWTTKGQEQIDRLLTNAELLAVQQAGWEIGAHGQSHVRLSQLSEAAQRGELCGSKARLEDLLGRPVTSFAYPYGDYSALTRRLVEEAGYTHAFTTAKRGGDGSRFALERYSLGGYGFRSARQVVKLQLALLRRLWSA